MDFTFDTDVILEDERVLIRPMVETDKEFFIDFLQDQDLNRYTSMAIGDASDAIKYVDLCLKDRKNRLRYPFVFYDKMAQKYAGTSCFGNIVNPHKRLEIGWTKIGKTFQGTGLNLHCKKLLLEYAFEQLQFNRVELKTHSSNIQSKKAMAKIGAKFEGVFRHHMIMPDGSLRDTVYYSFLREEWPEMKALICGLPKY